MRWKVRLEGELGDDRFSSHHFYNKDEAATL